MNRDEIEIYKAAIDSLLELTFAKTVDLLQGAATKTMKQFMVVSKKAFKKYLETAIQKYNEVKTIFNPAEPILLDSFYVGLDLLIGRKRIEGNIKSIMKYGRPLIVTGLAGSGKSTLLKFLFLETIKSKAKIPFFIELKNIKDSEKPFVENILMLFNDMNLGLPLENFLILLEKGEYILFFDGLDEISPALFDYVEQGIIDLKDKYYKSLFVVASRPNEVFQSWQKFSKADIEPLSKEKALMLLKNINYDTEIKERFIKDVKESLFDKHKSFLSNPLLLSIMLITYGQNADIPDKLTLFYQQAFEALFNKHDATKQGFKRNRYTTIPIDEFQKIISGLAIQSYIEHKINFTKQEIINYLATSKKIIFVQDYKEELVLKDLLQSLCIIVQDGLFYTFTHRSFQEYFTAIFISTSEKDYRKKIINIIKDKFVADTVFSLLFEIDKTIIEDNFFLKEIKKIKSIFSSSSNPEFSFLNEIFEYIDIGDDDGWRYLVKKIDYFELFSFFRKTYGRYYKEDIQEMNMEWPIASKKVGEYYKHKSINIFSIKELFNERKSLCLDIFKSELFMIKRMFELPDKVNSERKNKDNILDGLLSK
jgi:predicted NACHT family NTPase